MIIKNVKLSKGFLFLKPELIISTDSKKISLQNNFNESEVIKLNDSLKDFNLNSFQDFIKLKNNLKWLDEERYYSLEKALFNSLTSPWKFFNPGVKQVPRPMSVLISKSIGISEFILFSLNAKSFDAAISANRDVIDLLNKKLKNLDSMKEEDILILIKECIDEEHNLIDFELRIGVKFNNFKDPDYVYNDRKLNTEEQLKFVSKLIDKYSVCYVENPFVESDLDHYKKLKSEFGKKCLISLNSIIGEYGKAIDKKAINTAVVDCKDISDFNSNISFLSDKEMNIVAISETSYVDMIVGLGVPLIKLNRDKNSEEVIKRLHKIYEEIKIINDSK
ncbi:MAG TPA: hypothetical protein VJI68_00860 [Candidatus Nanoarchaeia archaeon]|nr:hypothetical protein [Candidatus Nanoarchaeia archaeon]